MLHTSSAFHMHLAHAGASRPGYRWFVLRHSAVSRRAPLKHKVIENAGAKEIECSLQLVGIAP